MSRTNKFPAVRAVLELVNTVVDEAGAKHITLANTNDPETITLIERAVEKVEKAEAIRLVQTPPVLPQWGERPLNESEIRCIEALISCQAEELKLSAYAIDKAVSTFFGVDTLRELKAWEYDGVMRYLVNFPRDAS